MSVEQRVQVGVLEVPLDEAEARLSRDHREVGFLDRPRVVVGEAVEAGHRRALGEEPLGQMDPMNPATPVISAFIERVPSRAPEGGTAAPRG